MRGPKGVRWTGPVGAGHHAGRVHGDLARAGGRRHRAHFFLRLDAADRPLGRRERERVAHRYRVRAKQSILVAGRPGGPGPVAPGDRAAADRPPRAVVPAGRGLSARQVASSAMADESTQSIDIAADPAAVMAVIADFDELPALGRLGEEGRGARGRSGRPCAARALQPSTPAPIRDQYELTYEWTGDTRGRVEPGHGADDARPAGPLHPRARRPAGTHVTYSLTVDLIDPDAGPAQAQGRAGGHGPRPQGAQAPRRGDPRREDRPVHRQGRRREDDDRGRRPRCAWPTAA